jgi:hypothetical protein
MNSEKMLKSILHTVQMGQSGIRSVQQKAIRPALKQELQRQLREYDEMEHAAKRLAEENNWTVPDIPKSVTKASDMIAAMRLMGGERDSKIAGMLIQGNTRGMILGMKNLRKGQKTAPEVQQMARTLISQERTGIEKTQQFL